MVSRMRPQNSGTTVFTSHSMAANSSTPRMITGPITVRCRMPLAAMATNSLSTAKRCTTMVAAKPAANGKANCSMGTMASDTYLSTLPGPSELSASGLMAAPNATTTTITDAVSSSTLSSSVRRCRQRIQGMWGGVWSDARPTASGQRRPYSFNLR